MVESSLVVESSDEVLFFVVLMLLICCISNAYRLCFVVHRLVEVNVLCLPDVWILSVLIYVFVGPLMLAEPMLEMEVVPRQSLTREYHPRPLTLFCVVLKVVTKSNDSHRCVEPITPIRVDAAFYKIGLAYIRRV